jgi:hypothetical protein
MSRWQTFRNQIRRPGTTESLVLSVVTTTALLGATLGTLIPGIKARQELNRKDLTDEERRANNAKSFMILAGALLMFGTGLSAVNMGRNVLAWRNAGSEMSYLL